ncbi:prepilin peptidase [Sulfitobacter sp. CW3]|uniref:A24 family peptidase n=1 Tax=Sulfitobacter sp. CW3 TaxID=2861965 RepID=UPI001C5D33FB|nr:prepilin peptidase [Sulfitobacter sp. CW3]MBW4961191.1 prepilin peptidase [Sulfitobacter sp. CW3]|tara:strand:- start:106098 stop:106592 length:495 start_codon:yes stop_codon:yes gene_type:complete
MSITVYAAVWFLPFVIPLCLYAAYTDMASMRITNPTVLALAAVFVVIGPIALPFETYLWHLLAMAAALVVGIFLNAAGVMGAGDAKFIAAGVPFVALGDLRLMMALLMATIVAATITHRGAKYTPIRKLVPHWTSWDQSKKFPMGLALGPTLAIYLILGALFGA